MLNKAGYLTPDSSLLTKETVRVELTELDIYHLTAEGNPLTKSDLDKLKWFVDNVILDKQE